VEEIRVGSLVEILVEIDDQFRIGIVMEILDFDPVIKQALGDDSIWYVVRFNKIELVVSSKMISIFP
jgi:hypothetical protein